MAQTVNPQTQTENVIAGQGARSGVRAEAYRLKNAAINQANNTGANNSLSRVSAYDQYQRGPSALDAFHQKPLNVTGPVRTVGAAAPATPPPAALPVGTTPIGPTASGTPIGARVTPYGEISATSGNPVGPHHTMETRDANGVSTGITSEVPKPFDHDQARLDLFINNPEIWKEGSPANQAFVNHAKQNGFQSAYENRGSILPGAPQPQVAANPTPAPAVAASPTPAAPAVHPFAAQPSPIQAQPEGNFTPYGVPTATGLKNAGSAIVNAAGNLYSKVNPYAAMGQ